MTIGAGVVVVAAMLGVFFMEKRNAEKEAADTAALWTVTGPPCPTAAPGAVATEPVKALEYMDGLKVARESGPINCNTIKEGGADVPVCMLLGPRTTRVTTAKGVFDFTPPAGENISIYVRDGVPSCVMNINRAVTG